MTKPPKTILGFDFGLKHIGVAVGQSITHTSSPLTTLSAKDGIPNWPEIEALILKWTPNELIVGLPLNMDGSDQRLTFCTRRFIKRLHAKSKLPVHEVDERLSSWEAQQYASGKKKDNKIHAYAAAILVEQWLHSN